MIRKAIIVMLTLGATIVTTAPLLELDASLHDTRRPDTGPSPSFRFKAAETGAMIGYGVFNTAPRSADFSKNRLYLPGGMFLRLRSPAKPPFKYIDGWVLIFDYWILGLALWSYPVITFIRGPLRRYRRRKRGLCVTCGYDLRGSDGRCPECGSENAHDKS